MTVTYVKNPEKAHTPPIPIPPTRPSMGSGSEPITITTDDNTLMRGLPNSSQSSLSQPPSRDTPPDPTPGPPLVEALATGLASRTSKHKRHENTSGYDKSTIEAVQVSVLVAMPQQPTSTRHTTESPGPLELGVVHIPLGHSTPRWAAG